MKQHFCMYEESRCPVDTGVQKEAVKAVGIVSEGDFPTESANRDADAMNVPSEKEQVNARCP
jgi:hypothetical protein